MGEADGPDDLSMNELPYPPLPSVQRLVEQGSGRLNRYPDHGAAELIAALAERLGVGPGEVVVGPGSAGLCQLLIASLVTASPGAAEVVHAALSFEAYPMIIRNAGAVPVAVTMDGFRHDLSKMADALTPETRCVLLCVPNNPTGAVLHRGEVEQFLDRVPPHVPVLVDEAYREFVTDAGVPDAMDLYRTRTNICVLRTFSKAYGLAGLRVGYAVVPPWLAGAARTASTVFFPGSLGQAAALASLAAQDELASRCAAVLVQRDRLREDLLALGLVVAPSEANFLWLPMAEQAATFATLCRRANILVRAIPGHGVRVAVGTETANQRLCQAVQSMIERNELKLGDIMV